MHSELKHWIAALVGAAAVVAGPGAAAADDDPPFTIGSQPAWFLLGGVTGGATVAVGDRGGYVGGELSLSRLRDGNYVGIYGDSYYDFAVDGTYVTGGLELGHKFVGLDGGPALRFADGRQDLGAAVRLNLSVGVFGIYVRYAYFDAMADNHVVQVGAMLKLPLMSPFGGN